MPVREAPDRRGRPLRGRRGLLERDSVLQSITAALDSVKDGGGEALLLEGHAGMGKTRLHEAALDEARRRGLRVLRAAGAELEQNVAFGVARQLVRALLQDLPPQGPPRFPGRGARAGAFAGRAARGAPGAGRRSRPDRVARIVHGDGRRGRDPPDPAGDRRPALVRRGLARVRPLRPASTRRAAGRPGDDPPPGVARGVLGRFSTGSPVTRASASRASRRWAARRSRSWSRTRSASERTPRWSRPPSRSRPATRSTSASCCWRWPRNALPRPPSSPGAPARWRPRP